MHTTIHFPYVCFCLHKLYTLHHYLYRPLLLYLEDNIKNRMYRHTL